jgi:type II secretory pathway pseudopilin PulG
MLRRMRSSSVLSGEDGFTVIESIVAAGIMLIAIVLSIVPVTFALRTIVRAQHVTVAENLAQARIEEVRSLDYSDVGHPDSAPIGVLDRTEEEVVEGRTYTVETNVSYVGSATGLDVIPQGGDGVEGSYDVGVNYKYVEVRVSSPDAAVQPVHMETIIAPPSMGALDSVAIVTVNVDRYEPYDPYDPFFYPTPRVQLVGPATYVAPEGTDAQVFADVEIGTYEIRLFDAGGWLLDPESVSSGDTEVEATEGWASERTIRIYRPASLTVEVTDAATGNALDGATLTLEGLTTGDTVTNAPGDYQFDDLVPDRYQITASAGGYQPGTAEVDVPGYGGGDDATGSVALEEETWVPVSWTFTVDFDRERHYQTAGADVVVTHPTLGTFSGVTDETGEVVIDLPAGESGFTVTASTSWGHDPDSETFSTGGWGWPETDLHLSSGWWDHVFWITGGPDGPDGFFEYKIGSSDWVRVPANDEGRATFVTDEAYGTVVQMRAYCGADDYPDHPLDTDSTTVPWRWDYSWNVHGWCR